MATNRKFWHARPAIAGEVGNERLTSIEATRPRRWTKVILTSAISGLLGGFLVSYAFPPRYTSQSLVLVEKQRVSEVMVPSLITDDFTQRLATLQQQVLAGNRLRPMVERLGVTKPEEQSALIQEIRANMTLEPVITDSFQSDVSTAKKDAAQGSLPGVYINYFDSSPRRAQQICNELTGLLVQENLRDRAGRIKETTDFLKKQVADARADLTALDAQLLIDSRVRGPRSPTGEVTYKMLVRDYDGAQKGYADLLDKLRQAKAAEQLEYQQLGEQWHVLTPANLPDASDFPDRVLFAVGGLGAGLMLGVGCALWLARKAKTEPHDVTAQGDSTMPLER